MTGGDFPNAQALLDAVLLVQEEESSGVQTPAPVAPAVNQTPVTTPPPAVTTPPPTASVTSGQSGTTSTTVTSNTTTQRNTGATAGMF